MDRRPQLLALDVDGTLLTRSHVLQSEVSEALDAARASGIDLVLASSRSPAALAPIVRDLPPVSWVISFQGAMLAPTTPRGIGPSIEQHPLAEGVAGEVAELALRSGAAPMLYEEARVTAPIIDERVEREAAITGEHVKPNRKLERSSAVYKVLCIGGEERRGGLEAIIQALPAGCDASRSGRNYLEVTAAGVDKGVAVRSLANRLGYQRADVAAIGDGENDIPLLRVAGTAIAMGNAPLQVREAADWTTGTNSDAGVATAIGWLLTGSG